MGNRHLNHPKSQSAPPGSNSAAMAPAGFQAPSWCRIRSDGIYLAIKLQPRAARNEIGEPLGEELRIRVTAPPVDAAANEALLRFLADRLNCPRGAVQLVRGHTARHKTVRIVGLTPALILERLLSQQ